MKFDEKTIQKHKVAVRKLMARGMPWTATSEIQWGLSKKYGVDFDLNYVRKLILEIQKDAERRMAYLATPEGQAASIKEFQERDTFLKEFIANL